MVSLRTNQMTQLIWSLLAAFWSPYQIDHEINGSCETDAKFVPEGLGDSHVHHNITVAHFFSNFRC